MIFVSENRLKAKKTSQKKQREPRFAFMTKSEVDHLEDGYRWRKYGQKAVKNSPFPRLEFICVRGCVFLHLTFFLQLFSSSTTSTLNASLE